MVDITNEALVQKMLEEFQALKMVYLHCDRTPNLDIQPNQLLLFLLH